jgi:RNA polymerase sigma-70 factor, ECF subfamily
MKLFRRQSLADFRKDFCPSCSDEELVERATGEDWAAFEELVRRYEDQFLRLAGRYFDNDADAHDALQMAFMKIYGNLDSFRGDAQFKSWAYRIVVNTCLSRIRKRKRRGEVALEAVGEVLGGDDDPAVTLAHWRSRADEAAEDKELMREIADAVSQLEPKYRSIFLLHEVEGLSFEQISETTELTVPGVKSRLHRARIFLRATLQGYLDKSGHSLLAS